MNHLSPSLSYDALSASDLFLWTWGRHEYTSFNVQRRDNNAFAYCGTLTTKFCVSCLSAGRGKTAVCGRRGGTNCIEKHACGARMRHANRKIDTRDDACGLILHRKSKNAEKHSTIDLVTRMQYSYETL